jgi:enoyl-CoA hydratase/carnithine racemase
MSGDLVGYSVSGSVAEIMLDRPPVNALSMELIDALLVALAKARDDEAVRAVIIGSAHKVFCAPGSIWISSAASPASRPGNFSSGCTLRSTIPSIGWASRPSPPSTAPCGQAA